MSSNVIALSKNSPAYLPQVRQVKRAALETMDVVSGFNESLARTDQGRGDLCDTPGIVEVDEFFEVAHYDHGEGQPIFSQATVFSGTGVFSETDKTPLKTSGTFFSVNFTEEVADTYAGKKSDSSESTMGYQRNFGTDVKYQRNSDGTSIYAMTDSLGASTIVRQEASGVLYIADKPESFAESWKTLAARDYVHPKSDSRILMNFNLNS